MPILPKEPDIYPPDLLDQFVDADGQVVLAGNGDRRWYAMYTRSRREKDMMRRLRAAAIAHYCPLIPKRYRSPAGRVRQSYVPLFSNYVFLYGDEYDRVAALETNCVSKWAVAPDPQELVADLHKFRRMIETGEPLTPESSLEKGDPVRVKSGPFKGIEGVVIRRQGQTRLLVALRFLERGASALLNDCELEPL